MARIAVDDIADERLAPYRNVKDGDLRREHGVFMAEGRLVVERLLEDSRFEAESVFLSERSANAMEDVIAAHPDVPVYVAKSAVMNEIVGFDLHRGCLAAGRVGEPLPVEAILGDRTGGETFVVVEGMTNTENLGSVFRNAMAFGVKGVLLCPRSCDPLYRKAIRVSLGASLRIPFTRLEDWPGDLSALRARGVRLVALDPSANAIELAELGDRLPPEADVALVLGTEGRGLSAEARAACDLHVKISMAPRVDSINVATAAAIAMQHLHERAHYRRAEESGSA